MEISGSDIVSYLIQIAGFAIALYLIGLQHKNSIKLQRENYKQETQIKLYRDIAQKISEATEKTINARSKTQNAIADLKLYLYSKEQWNQDHKISARAIEIIKTHHEALKAINELSQNVEQYLIINPKLSIFILVLCPS